MGEFCIAIVVIWFFEAGQTFWDNYTGGGDYLG